MHVRHDMIYCYVVRPSGSSHEFLQLRRTAADYMGGTWQTVVGTIEPGETAAQAALRELREETALQPSELYQLDRIVSFYLASQDAILHCPAFCAIVDANATVRLNPEHDSLRWVPRPQIVEHTMWCAEHPILEELCRVILDNAPAKPHLRLKL